MAMADVALKIYDFLRTHIVIKWSSLTFITVALIILLTKLTYKEDISDFLPVDSEEREALDIYQDISGADKVVITFSNVHVIDDFAENVKQLDSTMAQRMTAQVDANSISKVQAFVYSNIPYFLTEGDYAVMDSLLNIPGYINGQMDLNKQMLMFPSGGMMASNISRDPLNLFTPVVAKLADMHSQRGFEISDGYLFTPDMQKALVVIDSPYGNAETEQNTKLIETLEKALTRVQSKHPDVEAHITGGPAIAVGNARQIKTDATIAITLASIMILGLLWYYFRSAKSIILIAVTIVWGWLFAMGGIALISNSSVSIIVIGIASVIIGIAVNYPLHLVAHTRKGMNMREALKDISRPLIIGNITTVGAFLSLVPLQSTALRDLGLFASLLLIGTILFVLIWLPQFAVHSAELAVHRYQSSFFNLRYKFPIRERLRGGLILLITLVLAWFSKDVEFDANMANINYMTDEQKADMEYFSKIAQSCSDGMTTVYVTSSASSIDEALDANNAKKLPSAQFLVSRKEQARRLGLWHNFVKLHKKQFDDELPCIAQKKGFSSDAFSEFYKMTAKSYVPQPFEYFQPLTETVFAENISIDKQKGRYTIVSRVMVEDKNVSKVIDAFPGSFDVKSMNGGLAGTLSDNFNYIGVVCSMIVFLFLWASFGSLRFAVIAFLPMMISWIWILGLMSLFGVKFNIVNIILATFIFGQGDDYTIFMTEGCRQEFADGKPVLREYKSSILLSALIMFIGIGTLIVARHPALRSLAEVTIIGMGCVVLMAWIIPPMMFRLLFRFSKRTLLLALLFAPVLLSPCCAEGRVERVNYPSSINGGQQRPLVVYLPEGYDNNMNLRYPVLYLLHGSGGDENSWVEDGNLVHKMDSMIQGRCAVPMIVVMPNGNIDEKAAATRSMMGRIENSFVSEVMPYVENHYRTINDKAHRAIAGLSLGGLHTLFITANNPDKFDYVGLFSPQTTNALSDKRIDQVRELYEATERIPFLGSRLAEKLERKFGSKENFEVYRNIDGKLKEQFEIPPRLYYIACGRTDFVMKLVQMHRQRLDKAGYHYVYNETDGGHTWKNWRQYLVDFVPRLYK